VILHLCLIDNRLSRSFTYRLRGSCFSIFLPYAFSRYLFLFYKHAPRRVHNSLSLSFSLNLSRFFFLKNGSHAELSCFTAYHSHQSSIALSLFFSSVQLHPFSLSFSFALALARCSIVYFRPTRPFLFFPLSCSLSLSHICARPTRKHEVLRRERLFRSGSVLSLESRVDCYGVVFRGAFIRSPFSVPGPMDRAVGLTGSVQCRK
jgi:hypothetical protein